MNILKNATLNDFFVESKLNVIHERFELQEEICLGKSSTCFFGIDRETNKEIFIKLLIFPRSELEIARFRHEIDFLKTGKHYNETIRRYPEYIFSGELYSGRILFLITERVRGELLSDWIDKNLTTAGIDKKLLIAYRVFGASEFTPLSTAHRDLHPNNIILLNEKVSLFTEPPDYKTVIVDWGQSYSRMRCDYISDDDSYILSIHNGICREITTSFYSLPPETFKNWDDVAGICNKSDSWSMGLLFYKLLTGKDLFEFRSIGEYSESLGKLNQKISQARSHIISKTGPDLEILAEIFFRLMKLDPSERMSIQCARIALWFVIAENFRPTDPKEIYVFLDSPYDYKGVTWRHFNSDHFSD